MGIFKVARDSYTLAQVWRKWATGKQPCKDSLEMMKQQGFKQEDNLIDFCGNETTIFLNDEVASSGLTILIRGSKGGEICQNGHLVQILLGSVILTKSHHMRIQWWL
jgi:hypothetical protein